HVEFAAGQEIQCVLARPRALHAPSGVREATDEQFAKFRFVLDHQKVKLSRCTHDDDPSKERVAQWKWQATLSYFSPFDFACWRRTLWQLIQLMVSCVKASATPSTLSLSAWRMISSFTSSNVC